MQEKIGVDKQGYTLTMYREKEGQEKEFNRVWSKLADIFRSLPTPPIRGTLIRHQTDRTLFYSVGLWKNFELVTAARKNSAVGTAFTSLQKRYAEMIPGDCEIIAHVVVGQKK